VHQTAQTLQVDLVAKASLQERSHFQKMVIRIGDFLIAMICGTGDAHRHGIAVPS
jgi:hypothetical protein